MLVRCKIDRGPEGTRISFKDGTEYHFAANKRGDYVAEVEDQGHLTAFLVADTAYELYEPGPKKKAAPAPAPEPEPEPKPEDPLQPLAPEKGEG